MYTLYLCWAFRAILEEFGQSRTLFLGTKCIGYYLARLSQYAASRWTTNPPVPARDRRFSLYSISYTICFFGLLKFSIKCLPSAIDVNRKALPIFIWKCIGMASTRAYLRRQHYLVNQHWGRIAYLCSIFFWKWIKLESTRAYLHRPLFT